MQPPRASPVVGESESAGRVWLFFSILILTAAMAGTLRLRAADSHEAGPSRRIDVYVLLKDPPASQRARPALKGLTPSVAETQRWAVSLRARQAILQSQLETKGARVKGRYTRLINALRVSLPAERIGEFKTLPGVKQIAPVRHHQRSMVRALPLMGAPAAWGSRPGRVDGSQTRIGIIDTGIDYTHAHLGGSGQADDFLTNNPTLIEPGSFPTAKVVGGYDFAGDSYNASDPLHSDPHPDPDPLESASEDSHGTHVAGTAAGFGVLTNRTTFRGPYTHQLDLGQFQIAPGVAPGALLYALKVFGTNGTTDLVVEALEWAADPNGDYDFSDRLDVVNLSLGTSFGTDDPEDPELAAVNNLVQLGCVVVCSAGNDGNIFYATSTPGATSAALTVGSSLHRVEQGALQVLSPPSIARAYPMLEGAFTFPLADSGPIEGPVVYVEPHPACEALANAGAVLGKIALIDRGACLFTDKVQKAQDAGAIAVLMVNNVEGNPIVMGGENPAIFIPGVMISQKAGDLIKAHLHENVTVRLEAAWKAAFPELMDNLAETSSRGPVGLARVLKPEMVAPGVEVFSAVAGAATEGKSLSGTSMASPLVAGAAALLRQLHPDWTVETIKAALMNSAQLPRDAQGNLYPESLSGAGRLQVDQALQLEVTAVAAQAGGNVALSFGFLELGSPFQTNRTVLLSNHGGNALTFGVAVSNTVSQSGMSLVAETSSVTVPARGAASLRVTLRADPGQFQLRHDPVTPPVVGSLARHRLYEFSGQIWFHQSGGSLHLPFHAILRHASDLRAATNLVVLDASQAAQPELDLSISMRGASHPNHVLLSAFECGAAMAVDHLEGLSASPAQLLAAGAASDIATAGSLERGRVYFGLATVTSWATPQSSLVSLRVLIDTNHDRKADFLVSNDNATRTNASPDAADVFLTLVQALDEDGQPGDPKSGGFLNQFPANELDTAPFNNSVMVLSVPASYLGLSAQHSRFLYRVATFDPYQNVSETEWIDFDAGRPAIDTAARGRQGTPFYSGGQPVLFHLDRQAAAARRPIPPALLLLYHHNRQGERMEIVRLDLAQDDQDQDGMEDWWEMAHFTALNVADRETDSDRDGLLDGVEFRAGTDPVDPLSRLRLLSVEFPASGRTTLRWSSVAGKYYSILATTNLAAPSWSVLASNQFATPPANTFLDTNRPRAGARFYQVRWEP